MTRKFFARLTAAIAAAPQSSAVLSAALGYGLYMGLTQFRAEPAGYAVLALLGVLLTVKTVLMLGAMPPVVYPRWGKMFGWLLLAAGAAVLWYTPLEYRNAAVTSALWLFAVGSISFFRGVKSGGVAAGTLLFLLWALPFREQLLLAASYPLRLCSTELAAWLLKLCGEQVEMALTTIRVPGLEIAITDACSGIGQFEAMLLLGYFVTVTARRTVFWKFIHYAMLLPSIIAANAFRIALTVLLFNLLGSTVLDPVWHTGLGYAQTVASVALLYAAGMLLPERPMEAE